MKNTDNSGADVGSNNHALESQLWVDTFAFLNQQIPATAKTLWVGYSGGLDSTVLLYLLHQYRLKCQSETLSLQAIHLNHGLQPEASGWEAHCRKFCKKLNIPLTVEQMAPIQVNGHGLEQAARDARFTVFEKNMAENDVLCLGHHLQDQAETFLFRAIRGSGVQGLAAMKMVQQRNNFFLFKPLLEVSRRVLEKIASHHHLIWIDDPSNSRDQFDRNFLRNSIINKLRIRWDDIDLRFSRTADLCREQANLLDDLAQQDAHQVQLSANNISLVELKQLSAVRIKNFLGWWFRNENLQTPSRSRLSDLQRCLSQLRTDAHFVQNITPFQLCQSGQQLWLIPKALSKEIKKINYQQKIIWNNASIEFILTFANFRFNICIQSKHLNKIAKKDYKIVLNIEQKTLLLRHHLKHKTIKNIYQENSIPLWLRNKWPCLLVEGSLCSICGIANLNNLSLARLLPDLTTKFTVTWGLSGHFERADKAF